MVHVIGTFFCLNVIQKCITPISMISDIGMHILCISHDETFSSFIGIFDITMYITHRLILRTLFQHILITNTTYVYFLV